MNRYSEYKSLKKFIQLFKIGDFSIEDDVEDIHSQVEFLLTQKLGIPEKNSQRT